MPSGSILTAVAEHGDWQLSLYEDLHRRPELSMEEHATAERIERELAELGLASQRIGGTGVVAVIDNGEGATVLARADTDALPVAEDTGLTYSSEVEGVMHACGHDAHIASLLGAVRALHEHRDAWSGTYIALFQPGEEIAAGARAMVEDGLVEKVPRPDICFASHVMATEAGLIGTTAGPVLSAGDSLKITVHGRGAHGSMPHLSVDPVVLASSIVLRLQGIVSRELPPGTFAVITVGSITAGSKSNIIADRAELLLNIRTYDTGARRVKIMKWGIILGIVGSLLIALTPEDFGWITSTMLLAGRIVQGFSAAFIMPSTMALLKAYYDGPARQRAASFWSIGSWGGSGLCSLFGGFMATTALG